VFLRTSRLNLQGHSPALHGQALQFGYMNRLLATYRAYVVVHFLYFDTIGRFGIIGLLGGAGYTMLEKSDGLPTETVELKRGGGVGHQGLGM
jgi:hypothetical protein